MDPLSHDRVMTGPVVARLPFREADDEALLRRRRRVVHTRLEELLDARDRRSRIDVESNFVPKSAP